MGLKGTPKQVTQTGDPNGRPVSSAPLELRDGKFRRSLLGDCVPFCPEPKQKQMVPFGSKPRDHVYRK